MKELSIEEKAKAYDKALEAAIVAHKDEDKHFKATLERIFPELQESEEDIPELAKSKGIRKEIISALKFVNIKGVYDKHIAWLEKIGKQESTDKDETTGYNSIDPHFGKPIDKVEPKFHEGDWVVFNNKHQSIYQVEKIEDWYYILRHTHGGTFRVCVLHDESLRLWNIADAKDGDVLVTNSDIIFIFKYLDEGGTIAFRASYTENSGIYFPKIKERLCDQDVHPATQEQRNLLFQKMEEAGYEWDAEHKQSKKIEQNPTWSEEDENRINRLIAYFEDKESFTAEDDVVYANWLKSLKDKYTWKPSNRQMKAIGHICDGNYNVDLDVLDSIYRDFKKLMKE